MKKYVGYVRVSTKEHKQAYGPEAQHKIINDYVKNKGELIACYEERISGKIDEREGLRKALDHSKSENATLLIAKLDRLSRNVRFLFQLRESGVDISCCDLPELNTLTLGIFATMAQHERELISKRTKEGMGVAIAKGKKIGRVKGYIRDTKITDKIREAKKAIALERNKATIKAIRHFKEKGLNNSKIADELNSLGFSAPKGGEFHSKQVGRLLNLQKYLII